MALSIPRYIKEADIQNNILSYEWDDWNLEAAYSDIEGEDYFDRFEALSYRANIALTIASAEWVIYRYGVVSQDLVPYQYIEAAWAAVINNRYLSTWEPPDEDWMGPIRGPLSVAMLIIKEAVGSAEHEFSKGVPTSYISCLAKRVVPNVDAFLRWRNCVVERLEQYYLLDDEETWGEVVPREIFNLDSDFDVSASEQLIQRFLVGLDYHTNPFLQSPDEMIALKFEGTPYQFDIEDDRENRYEW